MPARALALSSLLPLALSACSSDPELQPGHNRPLLKPEPIVITAGKPVADIPGEKYFKNVRQLTFGGDNAEAYWSWDSSKLIFQSNKGIECDQIYILDLQTGEKKLVSTGNGRTTCAYFLQGDQRIIYGSTHLGDLKCPPPVMFDSKTREYVWPVYKTYDIFTADLDGKNLKRITRAEGYDAEATVCPVTGRVLFTSVRDGDLEMYSMEPDGSDVLRLTKRPGYDGGGFYSWDGTKIVARSGFPKDAEALATYQGLLKRGLVKPNEMELVVMDRNGENFRQITNNRAANFAPFWLHDNKRIIFASSMESTDRRRPTFHLYLINEDGSGLTRVTQNPSFDSFPMFSPCGKYIAFSSNRFNKPGSRDTNIFVAEWVDF